MFTDLTAPVSLASLSKKTLVNGEADVMISTLTKGKKLNCRADITKPGATIT